MILRKHPNNRWQKILYQKQPFPDNYTDETNFLADLRKNGRHLLLKSSLTFFYLVSAVHYTLFQAIIGTSIVMSQINVVVLYLILFESVQLGAIDQGQLFTLASAIAGICLSAYIILNGVMVTMGQFKEYFRTIITLVCFGYGFTPVIR